MLLKVAAGNRHLAAELLPLVGDLRMLLSRAGGMDAVECVVTYVLTVGETSVADLEPVFDRLGPRAKETIMSTAERLRAEGEARGEARARVEVLLELLTMKFATLQTEVDEVVRGADAEQVRVWTGRVLDAGCIEDVFGG